MERELWPIVYHALRAAARGVSQKYVQYRPWAIAAALLRAAIRDRPVSWADRAGSWSTTRPRPAELPSAATVSRRAGFGVFLDHLAARLKGDGPPARETRPASSTAASGRNVCNPLTNPGYRKLRVFVTSPAAAGCRTRSRSSPTPG